ncbi:hypothetical protein TIFTF001_037208 [Ficus carica]|uniref:Uncharacterized protein n=1 Tax=Ficus carica TaxID=3494 RepID=A0AA88E5L9_FICCA|nr:hypothetical protein TIFTF001_037185 [Ficus carica]GMN68137.1 hypothetical protein TIFTF001_037194 [Ficus carica]GMN68140.1 hypothetical protein TIFTF001_037199 [Ficus carica]GMN68151.1 hypothetical protein TIFTF001_037208 [Ficus carica]
MGGRGWVGAAGAGAGGGGAGGGSPEFITDGGKVTSDREDYGRERGPSPASGGRGGVDLALGEQGSVDVVGGKVTGVGEGASETVCPRSLDAEIITGESGHVRGAVILKIFANYQHIWIFILMGLIE